jgi:hypothetical protein
LLVLIGLGMFPLSGIAWATADLSILGSPDVVISSNSGPPGTRITITVSHIPDISKTSYPYPDLYIYLPFSQPFGNALSSHCGGQDCFSIYTHDDALNYDFADRTITFSLPSASNPKPVFLNGLENTVCDITVNGKVVERFSTLCNTKDEPQGLYHIRLAWMLETDLEQSYTVKTIPFIVTSELPSSSSSSVANNGDVLLKEYQNGIISQDKFYAELRSRGWTDEQIRQALGVIGKLPHQMGIPGPDNKLSFSQVNSYANSENNASSEASAEKLESIPQKLTPDINTNTSKFEQNRENNSSLSTQQETLTIQSIQNNSTIQFSQNNSLWNGIIIGLSISAAVIMSAVVIFVKTQKGKKNIR